MQLLKSTSGYIFRTTTEKNLNEFMHLQSKVTIPNGIYLFDFRSIGLGICRSKVRNNLLDETNLVPLQRHEEDYKCISSLKVNSFGVMSAPFWGQKLFLL